MKFVILQKDLIPEFLIPFTDYITDPVANALRSNFRQNFPQECPSYSLDGMILKDLVRKVQTLQICTGRKKALGITLGRFGPGSFLDLALEPICYDLSAPQRPQNPTPQNGAAFFGKLASKFSQPYFDDSTKQTMYEAVQERVPNQTYLIFLNFDQQRVRDFFIADFDRILVEFGLTPANKITIFLSRYLNRSLVITPGRPQDSAVYLDDNDLLP